jgi:pyridoxine 5-phosphate synthase
MTRLSVNINKIALLRNSRGANIPDVVQFAKDCERLGAQGITVHPRPDERHIRRSDVYALKEVVATEFNIEGYPSNDFLKMVCEVKPEQCTLVPDAPGQLTSDHGWDTLQHASFLKEVVARLNEYGIRVSLFIDPLRERLEGAQATGTQRIEFYTGPYAHHFYTNPETAIKEFAEAAKVCNELGLGINAGHDLNLDNLRYFKQHVSGLLEVSIGHALVRDCL